MILKDVILVIFILNSEKFDLQKLITAQQIHVKMKDNVWVKRIHISVNANLVLKGETAKSVSECDTQVYKLAV